MVYITKLRKSVKVQSNTILIIISKTLHFGFDFVAVDNVVLKVWINGIAGRHK